MGEMIWVRRSRIELLNAVFELMQRFDFNFVGPTKPIRRNNYGLWVQKNMLLRTEEHGGAKVKGWLFWDSTKPAKYLDIAEKRRTLYLYIF